MFVCFCSTNMCIQSFLNYSYLFLFLLRCLQSSNSLFLSQASICSQQLQPTSLRWDVMFFFFGSILKSIKQLQLMGEVQHLLRLSFLYLCYTGSSCQSTSHLTACVKPPGWQRPDRRSSNQKQDHARFTKRFPVPGFIKINLPTHLSISDNITTEQLCPSRTSFKGPTANVANIKIQHSAAYYYYYYSNWSWTSCLCCTSWDAYHNTVSCCRCY